MAFLPEGIIPAMVTPLDENENVIEEPLRKLTNHLIDGGVHGLFPVGSQGEFFALTPEEKRTVMATVIDETNGRVPVYAGTGGVTTREAVQLTQMAEDLGIDAVSVITPYFLSPNDDELYEYYKVIAENTSLPIMLYNNPGRTGVDISLDLVERVCQIDNIVGIKDSSGDMTFIGELISHTPDDFSVLAGRDTLIYSTLVYDGQGSITATANVKPELVVDIYEKFQQGDHAGALKAQYDLAPLRAAFSLGTFPVVVKEALNMIGIAAGPARSPVGPMDPDKKEELEQVLKDLEVL